MLHRHDPRRRGGRAAPARTAPRPAALAATALLVAAIAATAPARLAAQGALPPAGAAAVPVVPAIPYERFTLPNGLEVILHQDRSVPLVAVNVWYHVGSGDEAPGRTGFAHLFEHIMFMGSENVPVGAFDQWLEAAGASNNGSTNTDRTNYYEWMPSHALPLALWLEADRMGHLLPTMTQEKLDLQRDVVKNERRQSYDNAPYGRAYETLLAALYPAGHPYSWSTIGSMADLSAASLEDVSGFFRTFYAPNNASIAIAGDFEPDSAKAWVTRYFGAIPRGPALPPRPEVRLAAVPRDTFLVLEDRVQLPRLYNAWRTVPATHADAPALDLLAQILAGGKTSRLHERLVYRQQAAQDVAAYHNGMRLDGLFALQTTPRAEHTPRALQEVVDAEIARIVREGVQPAELQLAQNQRLAGLLDQLAGVSGKADLLNEYAYRSGDPGGVRDDAARYAAVTPADVQRVARTYLQQPRVTLTVVPEGKTELMVARGAR